MRTITRLPFVSLFVFFVLFAQTVCAQESRPADTLAPSAAQAKDVLVFANGDQLTGKLLSASGGNVVFQSDMAGQLTVAFDKIKELRSGAQFALLRKGAPVTREKTAEPVGAVQIANDTVTVTPPGQTAATAPSKDVGYLVDKAAYDREMMRKAAFTAGWKGVLTGGATLVRSTTSATTLTAGVSLVRAIPDVPWLEARNRTTVDAIETYGKQVAPGAIPQTNPPTPSVTTLSSIFHSDAERDEYFAPALFALGDIAFDHNYAQGLQLQQVYGAGAGWTVFKDARQELDVKADAHFERQEYITTPVNGSTVPTTPSVNLFGSTFFESYRRNLPRKVIFTETGTYLPAWNIVHDYSANFTVALAIPVLKKLSATISSTDDYLNDPAAGYRKNTFQLVTGINYTLP